MGLVFHPLDVLDPFPPAAVDTEYKPGEDALALRRRLPGGGRLHLWAVARRGGAARGSYGAGLRLPGGAADLALLLARHRGEDLAGLGLALPLPPPWDGWLLRVEGGGWRLRDGGRFPFLLANAEAAPALGPWPARLFLEAVYRGLGGRGSPDPALAQRLARGERFLPGRRYAAAGLELEPHPLLRTGLLAVAGEGAGLGSARLSWSWAQDRELELWALRARGAAASPLFPSASPSAAPSAPASAPPRWAWLLRLKAYR